MNQSRDYKTCHFCGGNVVEERVTVDYRWGAEFVAILRNVPTGVCQVCGERYFKAAIVKEMERVVRSKERAEEVIEVPVWELQVA
jgi:YgiT-type zinc finger domain-containing protein